MFVTFDVIKDDKSTSFKDLQLVNIAPISSRFVVTILVKFIEVNDSQP